MKKSLIIAALSLLVSLVGCGPKPDPTPEIKIDVTGEWELTGVTTKSAKIGDVTVNVYMSFAADGTFVLYQQIGQGRFRTFDGNWTLEGSLLSGKYSSGDPWAASYEVTQEGDTMSLAAVDLTEVDTYRKTTIPESVKEEAI